MLTISYKNLHALLLNDFDADELAGAGVEVDEATIEAVKKLDIKSWLPSCRPRPAYHPD